MNSRIIKLIGLIMLVAVISIVFMDTVDAQCPMCRMSAESNLKNGGEAGRGLNNGILYLLATPYLIIGGLAYVWLRNRKRVEDELEY